MACSMNAWVRYAWDVAIFYSRKQTVVPDLHLTLVVIITSVLLFMNSVITVMSFKIVTSFLTTAFHLTDTQATMESEDATEVMIGSLTKITFTKTLRHSNQNNFAANRIYMVVMSVTSLQVCIALMNVPTALTWVTVVLVVSANFKTVLVAVTTWTLEIRGQPDARMTAVIVVQLSLNTMLSTYVIKGTAIGTRILLMTPFGKIFPIQAPLDLLLLHKWPWSP